MPALASDNQASGKLPCALLGATGLVGERLARRLLDHPWFELSHVAGSEARAGQPWGSVPQNREGGAGDLGRAANWKLRSARPGEDAPALVFSALPDAQAADTEAAWLRAGACVISHAADQRMRLGVPLLVPEINGAHLEGFDARGGVLAQANCTTIGLVLALAPLAQQFGLKRVEVASLQALSGAGRTALNAGMEDDLAAFIPEEEAKLRDESRWILGELASSGLQPATFAIDASCHRVPIRDGHLLSCSVELGRHAGESEVLDAWRGFRGEPQERGLPSAPEQPLIIEADEAGPSPGRHLNLGEGQVVTVGRLRPCGLNHWRFSALLHNLERGAAGNAVLSAELLAARGAFGSWRPPAAS